MGRVEIASTDKGFKAVEWSRACPLIDDDVNRAGLGRRAPLQSQATPCTEIDTHHFEARPGARLLADPAQSLWVDFVDRAKDFVLVSCEAIHSVSDSCVASEPWV